MMSLWLQFHDKLGGVYQCKRVLIPLQKVQKIIDSNHQRKNIHAKKKSNQKT